MKKSSNKYHKSAIINEMKIHVEELVIGDLVLLIYGSKVPADIRLVQTNDLKFDKSMVS